LLLLLISNIKSEKYPAKMLIAGKNNRIFFEKQSCGKVLSCQYQQLSISQGRPCLSVGSIGNSYFALEKRHERS
jgi:hypothetical protein